MLSIFITALFSLSYAEVGFKLGNELEVQPVYGKAHVSCIENGFRRYMVVGCAADLVSPALRDRFVIDRAVDADRVELTSTFESGQSIRRSSAFDGEKGESKSSFNLWINTLTQTPILEPGKNIIDYKLSKKRELVEEGQFEVYVDLKQERLCAPRNLAFTYDCHDRVGICDDYFFFNNNCSL